MNLRRLLPARLRHHSRVLAIQCGQCGQWRNPRHIRIPAIICRDCETTEEFQNWKPTEPVTQPIDPQLVRTR